ncbi:MAG: carboxylate-amine ligase [Acidimicrobiia bacterium]
MPRPRFTIGIEEEYLLVDKETRDLVSDPPPTMMQECEELLEGQVSPEFLRSQIEVGTRVCDTVQGARADLARLRSAVAEVAGRYAMAPIAASTHPFARWSEQLHTDKERYNDLVRSLQTVARRLLISGMHVHVEIADEDLRIDLMNQVVYFLPHLLALSTSSPFWVGDNTGLASYRTTVFRSLPRTGLPEHFTSWGEYQRHVNVLVEAGLIEDATRMWWDIRPSARYPTLECRVFDLCTSLDDAICLAAVYLCVLRMLYRRRLDNQRWRTYANMLINENIWRAQRYGINNSLVDYGKGVLVPYAELLEEMIELVMPDAEEFGCVDEVLHARTIIGRGTSSDRQVAVYDAALAGGADNQEAVEAVVDFLIEETVADV